MQGAHVGGEAQPVDVAARVDVVERVEHDVEALEELEPESLVLDVAVPRRHLERSVVRKLEDGLARHLGLRAADVLLAEEELAVEVRVVNRVQVDHRDVAEAAQHQVLHQLAADAAGAHHEDLLALQLTAGEGVR